MKPNRWLSFILILWLAGLTRAADEPKAVHRVRVLLLGDSTCIGSICRIVAPHADHLKSPR
jgi:hypothetical protein